MADRFEVMVTWDPGEIRYNRAEIDSAYFDWALGQAEGSDVTVLMRANMSGCSYFHSKHLAPLRHEDVEAPPDHEAYLNHRLVEICERLDVLREAARAAKAHGVKIMAWFNLFEWTSIRAGFVQRRDRLWHEHPRKYWCSRDQSRFYHGVPVLGDAEVQERILSIIEELCAYETDGVYISSRTHCWTPGLPIEGAWDTNEPFGFDDSVVRDYLEKYGVHICYEDFDEDKWHRVKGEHLTRMLARIQQTVKEHGQRFVFGCFPHRTILLGDPDRPGPQTRCIQLYKEWEQWADDGLVDGLCRESQCPRTGDLEPPDVEIFKQTLPDGFPLYTWTNTEWFESRGGGPFSCRNWSVKPPETVHRQIELTREAGCAGAVIHSLYPSVFINTQKESHGMRGPVPKPEYWEALEL